MNSDFEIGLKFPTVEASFLTDFLIAFSNSYFNLKLYQISQMNCIISMFLLDYSFKNSSGWKFYFSIPLACLIHFRHLIAILASLRLSQMKRHLQNRPGHLEEHNDDPMAMVSAVWDPWRKNLSEYFKRWAKLAEIIWILIWFSQFQSCIF